ncbi:MAG: hypothetical protein KC589_00290 [Nanoarchaeota archaeon]|nr:hypothetical protein [Nanoarchaeota archaeon]
MLKSDNFEKKYVVAIFKALLANFFAILFIVILYLLIGYAISGGQIYSYIKKLDSIIFYANSLILFFIFVTYFLYKAKTEEF